MEAHLLSLNNFKMPTVMDKHNANYIHMIYLLLLDKGKFQSHPDMGVGLISRYRYNADDNMISNLEADIKYQIETYLPDVDYIEKVKVGLIGNTKELGIIITTDEDAYALSYDTETTSLVPGDQHILDELF